MHRLTPPPNTQTQRQSKAILVHQYWCRYAQFGFRSHLWIIFFMLLISMSPNACSGKCANAHPYFHPYSCSLTTLTLQVTLPHINLDLHTVVSFDNLSILRIQSYYCTAHPHLSPSPPQRSCHNLKRSSVMPLASASNCPQKAIALTVRMTLSRSGTSQESPT